MAAATNVYKLTFWPRIYYYLWAAMLLAASGFFVFLAVTDSALLFVVLALPFAAWAAVLLLANWRTTLVLAESRFELQRAVRRYCFERNQIRGLHRWQRNNLQMLQITLQNGQRISLYNEWNDDGAVDHWLTGIPDLDEVETESIQSDLSEDANEARSTVQMVLLLACAAGAGLSLIPWAPMRLSGLLLLLVLPAIAAVFVLRKPQLYTLFANDTDPRAELGLVFLFSGLGSITSTFVGDLASLMDLTPLLMLAPILMIMFMILPVRFAWKRPRQICIHPLHTHNGNLLFIDHPARDQYLWGPVALHSTSGRGAQQI